MTLPYFSDLNIQALDDYDQVNINLNGKKLQLDISFERTTIAEEKILLVRNFLTTLESQIDKVYSYIQTDFENSDNVIDYLNFHLEAATEDELNILLEGADLSIPHTAQLLPRLQFKRFVFYPEIIEEFSVFDFILNEDISQYLLVVKTNSAGELTHLEMES